MIAMSFAVQLLCLAPKHVVIVPLSGMPQAERDWKISQVQIHLGRMLAAEVGIA